MKKTLTVEQEQALIDFAAKNGRQWKLKLNMLWLSASAGPILQQVRNNFGPAWLASYTAPKKVIEEAIY